MIADDVPLFTNTREGVLARRGRQQRGAAARPRREHSVRRERK